MTTRSELTQAKLQASKKIAELTSELELATISYDKIEKQLLNKQ